MVDVRLLPVQTILAPVIVEGRLTKTISGVVEFAGAETDIGPCLEMHTFGTDVGRLGKNVGNELWCGTSTVLRGNKTTRWLDVLLL